MTRSTLVALVSGLVLVPASSRADDKVEFNRDVRLILSNHCFKCHGPDDKARQASLRLDLREEALKPGDSGRKPIVPGKPDGSNLVRRIFEERASHVMPPPSQKKPLTPAQKDVLRRWIEQGAEYQPHWAFVPPRRPSLPRVSDPKWPKNGLDHFILSRLDREGLKPSPEADRVTLIRRLTLDLTGLPPTPREVEAFLGDAAPDAYEKVVDRLLSSSHHGERMALDWLDAARYADTHGFHLDSGRDMWRWRDWVIDAFNRNKPFDEFTVEQVAGDLLPAATLDQKVASGFNRNHMINFEGGAVPQEYLNAYIVDRVSTTTTVWLGLSVACAQCHDHKFDPISQKEYYQLYAFFNNLPEKGLDGSKGNAAPLIKAPTLEQQARLDKLAFDARLLEKQMQDPETAKDQQLLGKIVAQLAEVKKQRDELEKKLPTTMVMEEMPKPRDTFLLIRGQYDKNGEKVTPGLPASLPPMPKDAPANRLGLARWLVDSSNPLTARVAVNRYWQMVFGTGLVRTTEEFGIQGELPSHPELLDWLAVEFMAPEDAKARGWDLRRLLRMFVTSAAYRQSSAVTPESYSRDPENRLLERGPRFRLQAEFIRDQALAASGLLNRVVGGASVSPYEPPGLWTELSSRGDSKNWSAQEFVQSKGEDLYRRSMYTFWKRTSPPSSMMAFDAPDRESCTVRRSRTNTPIQALVLMNDPTYVEASRKLAERLMREAKTTDERAALAFRLVLARTPKPAEVAVLKRVYEQQLAAYRKNPEAAKKLLGVGESSRDAMYPDPELAAWAMVASVVLNLDEAVTKG